VFFVSYVNSVESKINKTDFMHQSAMQIVTKAGVFGFHHVIICYSPTDVFVAPVTVIKGNNCAKQEGKIL
jgi:hypothetical protein